MNKILTILLTLSITLKASSALSKNFIPLNLKETSWEEVIHSRTRAAGISIMFKDGTCKTYELASFINFYQDRNFPNNLIKEGILFAIDKHISIPISTPFDHNIDLGRMETTLIKLGENQRYRKSIILMYGYLLNYGNEITKQIANTMHRYLLLLQIIEQGNLENIIRAENLLSKEIIRATSATTKKIYYSIEPLIKILEELRDQIKINNEIQQIVYNNVNNTDSEPMELS